MEYSAIDIKQLWYDEPMDTAPVRTSLTTGMTEIKNVHQDTWQIEEGEANQDSYRNQLTGKVYRTGRKTMGDLTINFTVGKYDWDTKANLMGGTVITEGSGSSQTKVGWKRGDDAETVYKSFVALTTDDIYVVIPKAAVTSREASTDGAIGIAISAVMVDPDASGVASEYWFEKPAEA